MAFSKFKDKTSNWDYNSEGWRFADDSFMYGWKDSELSSAGKKEARALVARG